ncbi:MAG: DNA-binding protein, partial [Actinobacteria bacterium]|nr:DNA-binding protein [Actinomycetota bacterium]
MVAVPISIAEAGLRAREHLQEWILAHPEILAADLRIISFEFDRWEAAGSVPTYDRLDILAMDRSGRLVVAELKRDRAPDTVTMHALNYAAMVSRLE